MAPKRIQRARAIGIGSVRLKCGNLGTSAIESGEREWTGKTAFIVFSGVISFLKHLDLIVVSLFPC